MRNVFSVLALTLCALSIASLNLWVDGRETLKTEQQTLEIVFQEDFDHPDALDQFKIADPDLGYKAGSQDQAAWRIEEGELIAQEAHNAALWLKTPLPVGDIRITFTAKAMTKEGDIKCEFLGDGLHHQSGYIVINGGWKNTVRAIARQDEHGEDRKTDRRCPKEKRCAPLGETVSWAIEKRGSVISWYLNEELTLRFRDGRPLNGRFFGFNNWSAETRFDNLRVYRLVSEE